MSRKVIGLVTAGPENVYSSRLVEGVCMRCRDYDYSVAVFGSLVPLGMAQEKFVAGEKNIYNLINDAHLDGFIFDGPSLMVSTTMKLIPEIEQLLKERCHKPVVFAGSLMEGYPSFVPRDRHVIEKITQHVIDVHHCRDLYFLGGQAEQSVTQDRLNGFRDALASRNIPAQEDHIFYGDFWYFGGANLAMRIISGEVPRPQAIICANDHMAIGLVNRLTENGIRVPEDIIVTGFDATQDAAINRTTITTIPPDNERVAVDAVDALRRLMEPGLPLAPYTPHATLHLNPGMSCGCNPDLYQIMDQLRPFLYNFNYDYASTRHTVDIGMLLESNLVEYLSDCESPQDCIRLIYNRTYLMDTYDDFYLCLDQNWLNPDLCYPTGYPRQIKIVLHNTPEFGSGHYENGPVFDTGLMLPDLLDPAREASLFYFMPVHFLDQSMGYAVLRHSLAHPRRMTCVIRTWLKDVSSGLHITRTTYRLAAISTRDGMTGAYNRRGMERMLEQMLARARPDDSVLAFVIDMDRLKYINDTFGHADGDFAISMLCSAAMEITGADELCVRAGGDEFYIIAIGQFHADAGKERIARFDQAISRLNAELRKPYTLSASIGSACMPLSSGMTVLSIIRIADARMFENKTKKRLQRMS